MDNKLVALYVQRGRLQERIRLQREEVVNALIPLRTTLNRADQARTLAHQAQVWVAQHPGLVAAAVVALVLWRPRVVWRTASWAYGLWLQWRRIRNWILAA